VEAICSERIETSLEMGFEELSRIPNVEVRAMSARIAHEQALFLRRSKHRAGDRSFCSFERRSECSIRETQIDAGSYQRRRSYDEILPWRFVNSGLSREFMQQEDERAMMLVQPHRVFVNQCTRCGVCRHLAGRGAGRARTIAGVRHSSIAKAVLLT